MAAAAGVRIVHVAEPSSAKVWTAASAVVVDVDGARRCAALGLARRARLFVVTRTAPDADDWPTLIALGVQRILLLPDEDGAVVALLSDAAESRGDGASRGAVIAVIGGCGGAGATVFATALAQCAGGALLVDADAWGGGIDLVMGTEGEQGLRWPDLALQGGRVAWEALHAALPSRYGAAVLSVGRRGGAVDAAAVDAVVSAGCRGGVTVVCDLPRRPDPVVETVLSAADLVVVLTPADVRSCASAARVAGWVAEANANIGLVVRGPAPGGLAASDVARTVGLPLLASMRPQPGLAATLEHSGLRLRRRSPLAGAARRVLAVLNRVPAEAGAA
ncbi:CpaE-like family protein [Mycolicibacterium sp. CAU 1645]|uniref:CpaE-like family protein n=2 Tax=Mycolicibacterium arenosum TaxID=2952157 RepID=A0ABT1M912_9MYCO|nr:CpaE-like family protein [Mycolicibacterium sp. CAU 1645]